MIRALLLSLALGAPACADTLIAAHTIRARSLIGPDDLAYAQGNTPGAIEDASEALGQEARVTLYAGRPIRSGDIGPPAIVERNQVVPMIYAAGGLRISTEARSLDRAAAGEFVRAMNLSSRQTVTGQVGADGTIIVSGTLP